MGIFLFIEVFTPYLDVLMYLQHFVMSIIPELFELQTSKTHKNFNLNKIRVGPIENCQTNRFLTIWQNIIFGTKFLPQRTQNQKFDVVFLQLGRGRKNLPHRSGSKRGSLRALNAWHCVKCDYWYEPSLPPWRQTKLAFQNWPDKFLASLDILMFSFWGHNDL